MSPDEVAQLQADVREAALNGRLVNLADSASIKAWGEQLRRDVKAEIARLKAEDEVERQRLEAREKIIWNVYRWLLIPLFSVAYLLWS